MSTILTVGNGHTLNGGGSERGLFDYAGVADLQDLTLANMLAQGGNGAGVGGGGGLAAGGDIFVQAGASLSIAGTSNLAAGGLTAGTGGTPGQAFGDAIYLGKATCSVWWPYVLILFVSDTPSRAPAGPPPLPT